MMNRILFYLALITFSANLSNLLEQNLEDSLYNTIPWKFMKDLSMIHLPFMVNPSPDRYLKWVYTNLLLKFILKKLERSSYIMY